MATKLIKKDGDTQYCVFACDTKDELSNLPTTKRGGIGNLKDDYSFHYSAALGSKAYVGSNNSTYRLFSDGWHMIDLSSGGSGGGSSGGTPELPDDYVFASKSDMDDLFKI